MDKDKKFAEGAFEEAILNNGGWQAFQKKVVETIPARFMKACEIVGWVKAAELIELVQKFDMTETFTDIWKNMFITGFVAGYTSRKEEEAEEAAKTTK